MNKIKFFKSINLSDLEDKVNEFLSEICLKYFQIIDIHSYCTNAYIYIAQVHYKDRNIVSDGKVIEV